MSDLISRQAAIREYQEVCKGIKCGECPFFIKVNAEKGSHLITDCKLEAFLHDLPSAQPEPKKGKWIMHIDDLFPCESTQECSMCHAEQIINGNDDNFCPNCGADMREEKDE